MAKKQHRFMKSTAITTRV